MASLEDAPVNPRNAVEQPPAAISTSGTGNFFGCIFKVSRRKKFFSPSGNSQAAQFFKIRVSLQTRDGNLLLF
ncbi:MAG: hypothetical protein V4733_00785 [Verrucomicrobiota bacterium]